MLSKLPLGSFDSNPVVRPLVPSSFVQSLLDSMSQKMKVQPRRNCRFGLVVLVLITLYVDQSVCNKNC